MADRPPTKHELHWFPFYPKDFLASPTVQRMTDADVGRYVLLLLRAWNEGDAEPTLKAADLKGVSKLVREQFTRGTDGLFRNAKLSTVWREQQEKYQRRKRAANSRWRKGKRGPSSNADAMHGHSSMHSTTDAPLKSVSRESTTLSSSTGAGGLAPDGPPPARAGARSFTGMESIGAILERAKGPVQ